MTKLEKKDCCRINKYKSLREQCADTTLIDILDLQDKKIDLLLNRVEYLVELVHNQSNSLYELSKPETKIFEEESKQPIYAEDFDEMFRESIGALEKLFDGIGE